MSLRGLYISDQRHVLQRVQQSWFGHQGVQLSTSKWSSVQLDVAQHAETTNPEPRRIVFLNRSDPCGRFASELFVVVQPPEFGSRSPTEILTSLPVTWFSSIATFLS